MTLQRIIARAVGEDIIMNESNVVNFKDEGNKVRVILENGQKYEGDLLVSADGIWSKVIAGMISGGVDRSIECSGDPRYILYAFEYLHTGRSGDEFTTDPVNFIGEKTLKGCFFGNYKSRSHLPLFVDTIMNQELELDKFVTYRFTFDEIKEALILYENGEDMQICIIRMGE